MTFSKLKSNRNILQLLKGSSTHAITQVIATIIGFFSSTQIARFFGPSTVGNIAMITSVLTLVSLISLAGNQTFVLKVLPEQLRLKGLTAAQLTYQSLIKICCATTLIVLSVWILSDVIFSFKLLRNLDNFTLYTMLLAFVNVFVILNGKTLRALGDYKYFSTLDFLPAILSLTTITIASALNLAPTLYQYLHFLPRFFILALALYFVSKTFNKLKSSSNHQLEKNVRAPGKTSLIKGSIPMLGITISTAAIANLDIVMLNYFSTPDKVGIYSIYVKIASVAIMATASINSMFAPKVSALYSTQNHSELKSYSKQVTLVTFGVATLSTIAVLTIHQPLLEYFGTQFTEHTSALYILFTSGLVAAFFGSVGFFLSMTGNQTAFFWIMLCAATTNAILNYFLIPIFGLDGAAAATLVSTLISTILGTIKIKSSDGYALVWTPK